MRSVRGEQRVNGSIGPDPTSIGERELGHHLCSGCLLCDTPSCVGTAMATCVWRWWLGEPAGGVECLGVNLVCPSWLECV